MTSSGRVDTGQFWKLIEDARGRVPDVTDSQAVAARAAALLSARPREEIVAAAEVLRTLLAESYRSPLWAAAYMINSGCSDDGFDDFRGWLIVQGNEVFGRIIADPDALADLPHRPRCAPRRGSSRVRGDVVYRLQGIPEGNGRGVPDARLHHPVPGAGSRMGLRF